jgi:hypothetical protein
MILIPSGFYESLNGARRTQGSPLPANCSLEKFGNRESIPALGQSLFCDDKGRQRWIAQVPAMGHRARVAYVVSRLDWKPGRKLKQLKKRLLRTDGMRNQKCHFSRIDPITE